MQGANHFKRGSDFIAFLLAQRQQKVGNFHLMQERLVTAGKRRTHALTLGGLVPVRSCRHGFAVGGEANQKGGAVMAFAHQLADVDFVAAAHLRRAVMPTPASSAHRRISPIGRPASVTLHVDFQMEVSEFSFVFPLFQESSYSTLNMGCSIRRPCHEWQDLSLKSFAISRGHRRFLLPCHGQQSETLLLQAAPGISKPGLWVYPASLNC